MNNGLSVVAAYHDEGRPFIMDAVNQIKETIDVPEYEIIIVDDHSREPLGPIDGVKVLRQPENLGVGQALRRGVWESKYDNIWFQGSDIRFMKNQWASKMIEEINRYPKALSCATCVGLNTESAEGMDIEKRKNRSRSNGARILVFWDKKSHPKQPENFRGILQAQWLPVYKGESAESFEVPCILGAAYGAKKEWLQYIDLFWGHRSWGGLEPYCSLASWFMGGSCRTTPAIQVGHIFKRSGVHNTPFHHIEYNKMLIATLLFEDHDTKRLIDFYGRNPVVDKAKKMIEENKSAILAKKEEYKEKMVLSARDYCDRWGIDFRENA